MAKNNTVRKSVRTKQPLTATAPRMIAAFNRNVQHLAAKGEGDALESIAESLGHFGLNSEWGATELAKALTLLVPLATPKALEEAVYQSIWGRLHTANRDDEARDFVDAQAQAEAERLGVKFAPCGCLVHTAGISGGVPCCNDFPVPPAPVPAPSRIAALRPAPSKPVVADTAEIATLLADLDAHSLTIVATLVKSLALCPRAA